MIHIVIPETNEKDKKNKVSPSRCIIECLNERTKTPLPFTMTGGDNAAIVLGKYELIELLTQLFNDRKAINAWLMQTTGFEYSIKLSTGGKILEEVKE